MKSLKNMLTIILAFVSLGLTACNGAAALISTTQTKTKVLIPAELGASTKTKPVCIAQKEETPEDSKAAASYYREVCLPAWNEKWETLIGEINERVDWLKSERNRIESREEDQQK